MEQIRGLYQGKTFLGAAPTAVWGENKVRLILSTALLLMLSCSALAAVETQQLGPYSVSFDMKTDMKYQMQNRTVENPLATSYIMQIITDNNTRAQVTITDYKNLTDATLAMYKTLFAMDLAMIGINVTEIADITIDDDKKGLLISGRPFPQNTAVPSDLTLYRAMYWRDSIDWELAPLSAGKTSVDIASTYPQDVTDGLLSSIQVVPAESPAK